MGSSIPSFDEVFVRLLCHSLTVTQSWLSKVKLDTLIMLSQSHTRDDSQSVNGGNRGKGQRALIVHTVTEWVTLENDVTSYMVVLHTLLTLAQSSIPPPLEIQTSSPTLPPQGITLTPNEYEEYPHLTQVAKSASVTSIFRTDNVSAYLTHSNLSWSMDPRLRCI